MLEGTRQLDSILYQASGSILFVALEKVKVASFSYSDCLTPSCSSGLLNLRPREP